MAIDEVRQLAETLRREDEKPGDSTYVRRGVVKTVTTTATSSVALVTIGGVDIPGVPFPRHAGIKALDNVDVLFDGPAPRILGASGTPDALGLVAYQIIDGNNRRGYGRYPGVLGADLTDSQTVTTTQAGLGAFVQNVPVLPSRVMRCRALFPAAGPFNANNEWYFFGMVSVNGGAFVLSQEVRYAPSGLNSGAPMLEMLFVTSSTTTTIGAGWDVRVASGTATIWRWHPTSMAFRTHTTLEDLGPV